MINRISVLLIVILSFAGGFFAGKHSVTQDIPETQNTVTLARQQLPQTQKSPPPATNTKVKDNALQFNPHYPFDAFKQAISSGEYENAAQIYFDQDEISDRKLPKYKNFLLRHLDANINNDDIFVDLSDAFLSFYYYDTDVLLRVAKHNIRRAYFEEAAQTYEFAYQNAFGDSSRHDVRQTFDTFLKDLDKQFANEQNWFRIIDLYNYVYELEVNSSQHRWRLAEVNLQLGNAHIAADIYRRLSNDPEYLERAQQALAKLEPNSEHSKLSSDTWEYTLPLTRLGQHYIAEVELDRASSLKLLVDTGASMTSISKKRFDEIQAYHQFQFLGESLFNTAGGITKGSVYRLEKLTLGHYELSKINIVVLDRFQQEQYDGLLGMNILENFRFQLDQDASKLNLRKR